MKRSDFLALIPAISSIPFIGSAITKTESGILLLDPKPEITPSHIRQDCSIDNVKGWQDLEFRLYRKEKHLITLECYDIRRDMISADSGMMMGKVEVRAMAYLQDFRKIL